MYESDWARVAQFGAGKKSGASFPPEVGDEVLIGFEFGDPRRPYVLGGLFNANTEFDLGWPGGEEQRPDGVGGTPRLRRRRPATGWSSTTSCRRR